MSLTRRKMFLLLPGAILSDALAPGVSAADDGILPSASFPFDSLPVHASDQAEIRPVLKGKLTTGESIEVHETTLQPGTTPHAAHRHVHSEMWLIREGTVEITVEGESHQIGPGSVGFVRSNDEHRIKNVGTTPAIYFVVAMGPGAGTS
jgi:mannose-6-phosphate isomerase-like protein (cupin superfamily)